MNTAKHKMRVVLTKAKSEVLGKARELPFIFPASCLPNPVVKSPGIPDPGPKYSGIPETRDKTPREFLIPA